MSRQIIDKEISSQGVGGSSDDGASFACRWIRPVRHLSPADPSRATSSATGSALLAEARSRVASLAAVERSLEDRIRTRWRQVEEDAAQRTEDLERELAARRARLADEIEEVRAGARARGRAAGYQQGFERGHAEGQRRGFTEGLRQGQVEGREDGLREGTRRAEEESGAAAAALSRAVAEIERRRDALLEEARDDTIRLAFEIASKLVKREVRRSDDVVLRNVERALELVLRRGKIAILVHALDAPAVEKALRGSPGWAEGFDALEIRAAADVERGGCRLVCGAGAVDMKLSTQIELLEEALGLRAPRPLAPADDDATSGTEPAVDEDEAEEEENETR